MKPDIDEAFRRIHRDRRCRAGGFLVPPMRSLWEGVIDTFDPCWRERRAEQERAERRRQRTRAVALVLWPILATVWALTTEPPTLPHLLVLVGATFAGGRIVAMEKVGSPLRALCTGTPFEELTSCPRCSGAWIALGLAAATSALPALWPVAYLLVVVGANFHLQDRHHQMVNPAERTLHINHHPENPTP